MVCEVETKRLAHFSNSALTNDVLPVPDAAETINRVPDIIAILGLRILLIET